jgi:hypothetical protein
MAIAEIFFIKLIIIKIMIKKLHKKKQELQKIVLGLLIMYFCIYVICESIVIYGLILISLSHNSIDFYIFLILGLLSFGIYFPRYGQWEKWIKFLESQKLSAA